MRQHSTYGEVPGPRIGEISRRSFMRRMLGVGMGLLSLEFLGGTLAFLWPNLTCCLGVKGELGSAKDIDATNPAWKNGLPFIYNKARLFLVNVPAGENLVLGKNEAVPDPGDKVKALYRKCPHLGCQIPQLCDKSHWFECLCHGSKYTILGKKRDGPAPRGMDGFNVTVANGVYVVDTSQIITGPPIGTATFDNRGPGDMQHCTG
jgi:cytochrome b6-f complex iron-sulfur subunit